MSAEQSCQVIDQFFIHSNSKGIQLPLLNHISLIARCKRTCTKKETCRVPCSPAPGFPILSALCSQVVAYDPSSVVCLFPLVSTGHSYSPGHGSRWQKDRAITVLIAQQLIPEYYRNCA